MTNRIDPNHVFLVDNDKGPSNPYRRSNRFPVDTETYFDYLVSQGKIFLVDNLNEDVANDAFLHFLVKTPSDAIVNAWFAVNSSIQSVARLYQDTTVSANGTEIVPVCFNRENVGTTSLRAFDSPTITSNGSRLSEELIPAERGRRGIGSVLASDHKWILKKNTHYLFSIENTGRNTGKIDVILVYYEEGS